MQASLSLGGSRVAFAGLIGGAALMIAASACDFPLGYAACAAGLVALGAAAWRKPQIPIVIARHVSWSILPLVAGLFVLVGGLEQAGLLGLGSHALAWLNGLGEPLARLLAGAVPALLSNFVNNLPVGLLGASIVQHAHAASGGGRTAIMAHAILIGVDLGPNLSVTGSLATILWLIALRREGVRIGAGQFLKVGLLAMPPALILSLLLVR